MIVEVAVKEKLINSSTFNNGNLATKVDIEKENEKETIILNKINFIRSQN